jgi:hypothetical protein
MKNISHASLYIGNKFCAILCVLNLIELTHSEKAIKQTPRF